MQIPRDSVQNPPSVGAIRSQAVADSSPPIPPPDPGTNRTYNGTFRIAAANDADPLRDTSTVATLASVNGTVRAVNRTVATQPVVLGGPNGLYVMTPRDALATARQTDAYYTSFDRPMPIPYRDQWRSLAALEEIGWLKSVRIVPRETGFRVAPPSGRAADAQAGTQNFSVTARIASYRDQLPVRSARVEYVNGSYYVANPGEARVNLGKYRSLRRRKAAATQALLRYSERAPTHQAARKNALVPTKDGTELFPTRSGAAIPLVWRDGSTDAVHDAYVGIVGVAPGAWYRDAYLTVSDQSVFTYVPWDYRVQAPADYTESGTCRVWIEDDDGNESASGNGSDGDDGHWENYSTTKFAEYTVTDWTASVERVSLGSVTMSELEPGVWTTEQPSGHIPEAGPGRVSLRAEVNISVTVKRHYGERDGPAACNWEKTDHKSRTMVLTTTQPAHTVPSNAPGLQVDVQVYDRLTTDVVVVRFQGNQSLRMNPWHHINVTVGNETVMVQSPWRFYPVVRNDVVEQRTAGGTTTHRASYSWNGSFPHLYRTRVAVAPISTRLKSPSHAWWEPRPDGSVAARSISGTDLPATIVAPGNANGTTVYARYVGQLHGNAFSQGELVSAGAEPLFGTSAATDVTVTRYREAGLAIWTASDPADNHTRVYVRLTDMTGDPIAGRQVTIQGATPRTVTTNASGMASARVTGPLLIAQFEGDRWQASHSTYYGSATNVTASAAPLVRQANSVVGYLAAITSGTVQISAWVVLGLFLVWWRWYWGQPGRS